MRNSLLFILTVISLASCRTVPTPLPQKEINEPLFVSIPSQNPSTKNLPQIIDLPDSPEIQESLTEKDYINLIKLQINPDLQIIQKEGLPLYSKMDLNGDSYDDFVFLLTKGTNITDPFNLQNLYNSEIIPQEFFLQFFYSQKDTVSPQETVPLGTFTTIENLSSMPLNQDNSTYLFNTRFFSQNSMINTYVIHSFANNKSAYNLLQFTEDFYTYHYFKDLDSDGVLELVKFKYIFSSGTGNAYLSLHRLNGVDFTEEASINLITLLNDFLQDIKSGIIEGDKTRMLEIISPNYESLDFSDIDRFFVPRDQDTSILFSSEIQEVFIPEIHENIFTHPDQEDSFISLGIKTIESSGSISFYTIKIAFTKNPFSDHTFQLLLN